MSADPMLEFAEGRTSKDRAVAALGLRDYAQQRDFVGLLREARRDRALHARRP